MWRKFYTYIYKKRSIPAPWLTAVVSKYLFMDDSKKDLEGMP